MWFFQCGSKQLHKSNGYVLAHNAQYEMENKFFMAFLQCHTKSQQFAKRYTMQKNVLTQTNHQLAGLLEALPILLLCHQESLFFDLCTKQHVQITQDKLTLATKYDLVHVPINTVKQHDKDNFHQLVYHINRCQCQQNHFHKKD